MGICGIQLVYALVIMLGPITFGTIMCYPSPTGPDIREVHNLQSDSLEWSFYNSVSSLFAIAGPFITSGLLAIFKGKRKLTVFTIAVLGTCFWLLNLLTKLNIWAGIVVRAFLGTVMGMYSSISPMYLVEIAPENASGFFGCLNQIGIVLGIVFFDFIGPSLTYMEMDYVGAAVTALQAILIWFIEESPALSKQDPANTSNQEQQNNQKAKESQVEQTESMKSVQKESLWQKKYMFGLFSGVLMMLLQQFSGINAILTNLADLMNASGLDINGNYQAGIASLAQLIAVIIGGLIMDKLGRKIVWMLSCSIIVVFLLVFALNVKYDWSTVLPLVCIFLYQLGFGLGMGPIPWFIIPEYFNDNVRPIATTIVSASNWVFSFIIIFVWPAMQKGLGMFGSLLFFMFVTVGSIVFGAFAVHDPLKEEILVESDYREDTSSEDQPEAL